MTLSMQLRVIPGGVRLRLKWNYTCGIHVAYERAKIGDKYYRLEYRVSEPTDTGKCVWRMESVAPFQEIPEVAATGSARSVTLAKQDAEGYVERNRYWSQFPEIR